MRSKRTTDGPSVPARRAGAAPTRKPPEPRLSAPTAGEASRRPTTRDRLERSFRGDEAAEATATTRERLQRQFMHARTPEARQDGQEDAVEAALAHAAHDQGAPIGGAMRDRVERATGAELGDVRLHAGAPSHRAAAALGARAFTLGHDVYFAEGQFRPGTSDGDRLIAHELVHAAQQGAHGREARGRLEVSRPGDGAEREAELVADAVMRGEARSAGLTHQPPPNVVHRDDDKDKKDKKEPALLTSFAAKFPKSADIIRKSPEATKLVEEANTAGVKFGGFSEDGPAKDSWPYTVGSTVYVPKANDTVEANSSFLFELNNALRKPQFAKLDEEAKKGSKGSLTAKEYARKTVELEVEGMLRHGEVWVDMKKQQPSAGAWDQYDASFYKDEYQAVKDGKKSKADIVKDVLQRKYPDGKDKGKTVEQFYMEQYDRISGGK